MFIIESNYHSAPDPDKGGEGGSGDPASAAAAGGEGEDDPDGRGPNDPPKEELTDADKPTVESMRAAMVDALPDDHKLREDQPKSKDTPKPADKAAGDLTPEQKAEADKAAADKAAADKAAEAAKPTPTEEEAKAAVEKEITDLNIKNPKAQERFREMSDTIRDQSKALKERETDVEAMKPYAQMGMQWEENIQKTGAEPEEVGRTLAFLHAYKSNDPVLWAKGLEVLDGIRNEIAEKLGIETTTYNPLAEYTDLADLVKKGELDKGKALEIAKGRKLEANLARTREENDKRSALDTLYNNATNQVVAFTTQLAQSDPQFTAKFTALKGRIADIQRYRKPEEWLPAIKAEFEGISRLMPAAATVPAVAAATVPPVKDEPVHRVGRVPGRASGAASAGADKRQMGAEITDPMDGLKAGLMDALESEKKTNGRAARSA